MIVSVLVASALATGVLLVPKTSWAQSTYSGERNIFPSRVKAQGKKVFVFSPKHGAWAAYLPDGTRVGHGRASGGSNFCKDVGRACRTPGGIFYVRSKGAYECRSSKYPLPRGGAHMPYCMHFYKGYAIHGAPPEKVPTYNASHGCIRVTTSAAKWLRDDFLNIGTKVHVLSY